MVDPKAQNSAQLHTLLRRCPKAIRARVAPHDKPDVARYKYA
jgi:hypothetical protein